MPSEFRRTVSETLKRMTSSSSSGSSSRDISEASSSSTLSSTHTRTSLKSKGSSGSPVADSSQRSSLFIFWGRSEGDVEDKYELGEEIGRGAFGVVRKARDISTGGILCCKSIQKGFLTADQLDEVTHETEVLLHLRGHPNIVTVMGVFEDEFYVNIVAELCSGPSLEQLMHSQGALSEREARQAMQAVLEMLAHCHSMGVLYRDVKPEHFLLSDTSSTAQLKAIDFGISIFLKPDEQHEVVAGTPTYWAPEVFDMQYGYPSDLWSCGVMMYLLLCGEFPFKGRTEPELYRSVCSANVPMEGDAWRRITEPAKDFLRKLLRPRPSERMTAKDALAHIWITHQRPAPAAQRLRHLASFRSSPPNLGTLLESPSGAKGGPGAGPGPGAGGTMLPHVLLERMRCYSRMTPFKRMVMLQLVRQLENGRDLVGMQTMFCGIDTDRDGSISAAEVMHAFKKQGALVVTEEIEQLVRDVDANGNGVIDPSEFLAASLNPALLEKQDLLSVAFNHFDCDKNGSISQYDLQCLADSPTISAEERQQVHTMLEHIDVFDEITFDSFLTMMMDKGQPRPSASAPPRRSKLAGHKSAPALAMMRSSSSSGRGGGEGKESCAIM